MSSFIIQIVKVILSDGVRNNLYSHYHSFNLPGVEFMRKPEDLEMGLRLIKGRHPNYTEIIEAELDHYKELCSDLIKQNNELKAQLHKEQLEFHFK